MADSANGAAMTGNPLGWPKWLWRAMLLPVALFVLAGLFNNSIGIAAYAGLIAVGDRGFTARPLIERPGWHLVESVDLGSAAAQAGLVADDRLRYRFADKALTGVSPGEPLDLIVERDGIETPITVMIRSVSKVRFPGWLLFQYLAQLLSVILGVILLVRGRSNRAAPMLGVVLLTFGIALLRAGSALSWPVAAILSHIGLAASLTISFLWPCFALVISGGAENRQQVRNVVTFAAISMVAYLYVDPPGPARDNALSSALVLINQLSGYAIIAWNYRRNDAATRNRLKIVLLAFVCYLLWTQVIIAIRATNLDTFGTVAVVFGFIAPALLTYAVLGQRLFDFGFAINRTLVYGAVAFTLLATFGLLEYGAKSLIPKAWIDAGPFVGAGIAVLLYLSFHRMHGWFEHHIERLFFHKWQQAEAALRRFVGSAGHFEDGQALCGAFAVELARFSCGASAAIYQRTGPGACRLEAGDLAGSPEEIAGDNPAFALMKAERRPIEIDAAHLALPGVLALPMLDHGTLAGFALLGPRPDGLPYRPDETELLGWAAHQVGLDLQALRARALDQEVVSLRDKVSLLTDIAGRPRSQNAAAAPG